MIHLSEPQRLHPARPAWGMKGYIYILLMASTHRDIRVFRMTRNCLGLITAAWLWWSTCVCWSWQMLLALAWAAQMSPRQLMSLVTGLSSQKSPECYTLLYNEGWPSPMCLVRDVNLFIVSSLPQLNAQARMERRSWSIEMPFIHVFP